MLRCFGLTPARHSSSKPAEEYDVTDSAGGAETGGAADIVAEPVENVDLQGFSGM